VILSTKPLIFESVHPMLAPVETAKGGDPMSSGIKGFLALSAFVAATVIGSAAFADCAGHKTKTATTTSSQIAGTGAQQSVKKPTNGG